MFQIPMIFGESGAEAGGENGNFKALCFKSKHNKWTVIKLILY